MFELKDYTYNLPPERIAQKPADRRDGSRLLFMNRKTGDLAHHVFSHIPDFFSPGDVLVINNTEVIPGRIFGKKETGGSVELLILNYGNGTGSTVKDGIICNCLVKASKRPKIGTRFFFDMGLKAEILETHDMVHRLKFSCPGDFESILYQIGRMPLPPYIHRKQDVETPCDDKTSYQTVYACQKGAVAAPTAGLHFTNELLDNLKNKGVKIVSITLHVGYGTFVPVRVSDIREHQMHSEWYSIPLETANTVNSAKSNGGRIVAVGTTSVRTLEYASDEKGMISEGSGNCNLFIYPGYRFKMIDAMITNFHLPESTLLMLVSAFAGRDNILNAYKKAVKAEYRFYSYGDAMLIT